MSRRKIAPLRLEYDPIPADAIELDFVKSHLRVSHSDDDALIAFYVRAAIDWAESATHRSMIARDHVWTLKEFPHEDYQIWLPRGRTVSISSIQYVLNGATTTLAGPSTSPATTADFQEELNGDSGAYLRPLRTRDWPDVDIDAISPVKIHFRAGYTQSDMPPELLHAILMAVTDAYDLRGSPDLATAGGMLDSREKLISAWRLHRWYP